MPKSRERMHRHHDLLQCMTPARPQRRRHIRANRGTAQTGTSRQEKEEGRRVRCRKSSSLPVKGLVCLWSQPFPVLPILEPFSRPILWTRATLAIPFSRSNTIASAIRGMPGRTGDRGKADSSIFQDKSVAAIAETNRDGREGKSKRLMRGGKIRDSRQDADRRKESRSEGWRRQTSGLDQECSD